MRILTMDLRATSSGKLLMWIYRQSTGQLFRTDPSYRDWNADSSNYRRSELEPSPSPILVATCYSGRDWNSPAGDVFLGRNNPALQDVANVGPIPRGRYHIGPFGDYTAPLTPYPDTDTFGRIGLFFRVLKNGFDSGGSIIIDEDTKRLIIGLRDQLLLVVE